MNETENSIEQVILVNETDVEVGSEEKMAAHQKGLLHRAFSVFIFNEKGQMLLQKRASHKYHSGGLWTNTCCSHPRPGEKTLDAAHRRLKEEMGFDCKLRELFSFMYKKKFENGLTEHEFDHVIVGNFDGEITVDPKEVEDWKWVDVAWIKQDLQLHPANYSYWFTVCFGKLLAKMKR